MPPSRPQRARPSAPSASSWKGGSSNGGQSGHARVAQPRTVRGYPDPRVVEARQRVNEAHGDATTLSRRRRDLQRALSSPDLSPIARLEAEREPPAAMIAERDALINVGHVEEAQLTPCGPASWPRLREALDPPSKAGRILAGPSSDGGPAGRAINSAWRRPSASPGTSTQARPASLGDASCPAMGWMTRCPPDAGTWNLKCGGGTRDDYNESGQHGAGRAPCPV